MTLGNQWTEVTDKQRAQQCGDMQSIGVRIGEDTDLVIAQGIGIFQGRVHTQGNGDIVDFLGTENLLGIHLPGIQDLAAQGHNCLVFPIAGLLGRTPCRVTLHKEDFTLLRFTTGTVGQLARQCRSLGNLFAHHLFTRPHTALGGSDTEISQLFRLFRVLVQPQTEGILNHTGDKSGHFPR